MIILVLLAPSPTTKHRAIRVMTELDQTQLDRLRPHPLAELFPSMTGDDFERLHADITAHGVIKPIVLCDGLVLVGRSRVGIARQLRIAVPSIRFEDINYSGTPLDYVVADNCYRHHYKPSQRIMIAARIANMKQGARTDLTQPSVSMPKVSQAAAAEAMGVGVKSVTNGRYILDHGTPEEIEAAVDGKEDVTPLTSRIRARIEGTAEPDEPDNIDRAILKLEEALTVIGTYRGLHIPVEQIVARLEVREQWDRVEIGKSRLGKMFKQIDAYDPEGLFDEIRMVVRASVDEHTESERAKKAAAKPRPKDEPEVEARRRGAAT